MTFDEWRVARGAMTAEQTDAAGQAWEAAVAAERERCAALAASRAKGYVTEWAKEAGYSGVDEGAADRAAYVAGVRAALSVAAAIRWGGT